MDIYTDKKRDIKIYVRTQGKTKLSATFARFIDIDQIMFSLVYWCTFLLIALNFMLFNLVVK